MKTLMKLIVIVGALMATMFAVAESHPLSGDGGGGHIETGG